MQHKFEDGGMNIRIIKYIRSPAMFPTSQFNLVI